MVKWLIFVVFAVLIVIAMRVDQLWTIIVLIPTFAWLYNWAEIIYSVGPAADDEVYYSV